MKLSVFSSTGSPAQAVDLPASLFEAKVNKGLMHLALIRQQSNRRHPIAHVKRRSEVAGSTKKLYQQKGTGRARRGSIRSPLLRGGGKSFGPRKENNFTKDMPQKMRRAAILSCLSYRAKEEGTLIGLESYPDQMKTKTLFALLQKLPVQIGRSIIMVIPAHHKGLEMSARNIPRVKTLLANYLNPEDVLGAKNIIFLVDALKIAEETFGKGVVRTVKEAPAKKEAAPKAAKKAPAKKKTAAKKAPAASK